MAYLLTIIFSHQNRLLTKYAPTYSSNHFSFVLSFVLSFFHCHINRKTCLLFTDSYFQEEFSFLDSISSNQNVCPWFFISPRPKQQGQTAIWPTLFHFSFSLRTSYTFCATSCTRSLGGKNKSIQNTSNTLITCRRWEGRDGREREDKKKMKKGVTLP